MKILKSFLLISVGTIIAFIGGLIYCIIESSKKNGLVNTLKMIENGEDIFTLNTYTSDDETEDKKEPKIKMGFCKD